MKDSFGRRLVRGGAIPMKEGTVKLVSDILTGKDNLTYDAARVVGVLGALAYIVFWAAAVWGMGRFTAADAAAYGSGLGLVMVAMGSTIKLKEHSEPEPR